MLADAEKDMWAECVFRDPTAAKVDCGRRACPEIALREKDNRMWWLKRGKCPGA